jgi:hypothetical protein
MFSHCCTVKLVSLIQFLQLSVLSQQQTLQPQLLWQLVKIIVMNKNKTILKILFIMINNDNAFFKIIKCFHLKNY